MQALGSNSMTGRSMGRPLGAPSSRRVSRVGGRHRASRLQCSAAAGAVQNPFLYPREMDGLQAALSGLPTAGVYVVGAALTAGMGAAGFTAAQALAPEGLRAAAKYVAAAAGAALGAWAAVQLRDRRQAGAIVELANLLVSLGDPTLLTRDMVTAIESNYGLLLTDAACLPDTQSIYGTFVEAAIPLGDAPMSGAEPQLIQAFKATLGLSDVDAAPVHLDVGRRILRGRMEAGTRGEDIEARKTFQKLIYVSGLVFGDRQAAFLLPWARIFGLSDAQVYVAKRDNAKGLFRQHIDSLGGQLQAERGFLVGLKAAQAAARLADDEAATLVKDAARARVEALLEAALQCTKQRSRVRDYTEAVDAMQTAVDFNRGLTALASDPEVIAGVGPTCVLGGTWEQAEGRSKDLRELFKVFVDERMARDGGYTDALEADAGELRALMGLGAREVAAIADDVKQATYKRLLREEVTSGRLAAAASKAEVLGDLVERTRLDAESARAFHESLYRQKLSSLLEKKSLTDADDESLREMQVMLCIQESERAAMHAELCGALFKDAVNDALSGGIEGFGFTDRQAVAAAFRGLRMDRAAAREVLDTVARKYLLAFVTASRNLRNRIDAAKELRKLVLFSNVCVAPLVEDLKTEEEKATEVAAAEQQKQMMELMQKAREDAAKKEADEAAAAAAAAAGDAVTTSSSGSAEDAALEAVAEAEVAELLQEAKAAADKEDAAEAVTSSSSSADAAPKVKSLEKAEVAAAARAGGEAVAEGEAGAKAGAVMKSQKDVTLAKDLDLRDRTDIYKNFLMYCMTGDVVQGPMGVTMVTERDEGEFARLSQLGDVLGLSQMDVYEVHTGMAEQAFKQQVQSVMGEGGGALTPDRSAALERMREQMGLSKESADKIIRGFTNQKAIASMQALKAQGRLSLERVLECRESGLDVSTLLGEDARYQLYRQEVVARLTDGTGGFDPQRMTQDLPAELGLEAAKCGRVVVELAKERKHTTLVQAVSFLRQKKVGDAAGALNNLVSCEAAMPSAGAAGPVWNEREEVQDLFSAYITKESAPEKQAAVQAILGLSDGEADNLRAIVAAGGFKVGQEEAEEAAFF